MSLVLTTHDKTFNAARYLISIYVTGIQIFGVEALLHVNRLAVVLQLLPQKWANACGGMWWL